MIKIFRIALCLAAGISINDLPLFAEYMSNDKLLKKLTVTKAGIEKPESSPEQKSAESKWSDRINISGVLEVEAAHESMDFSNPDEKDTDAGDIALATVEFSADAEITDHISGHLQLLWEEDNTEPIDIDEGFISISGGDAVPLYLEAGKMYVPFGAFKSHFIRDPITLEIGETRESAVRFGYVNSMFDVSVSFFNGDTDETGDDDSISTFVGSAVFTLPEDIIPDFGVSIGASYISNIADSDGLSGEVGGQLTDSVGGFGFFLSSSYMERYFIEVEYIGATSRFASGELSFDNGIAFKPSAYNIEIAWLLKEAMELAVRYEGGDDLGDFLPEKQYGCAFNYTIFKNISLGIEYLRGKYSNDVERDLITAQIIIGF